jgi:hypothetical protein
MHIYRPAVLPFDVTPVRVVRIVIIVSHYIANLQVMILALKEAAYFLAESILIVMIFGCFFTLQGLHLFTGREITKNFRPFQEPMCRPPDGPRCWRTTVRFPFLRRWAYVYQTR